MTIDPQEACLMVRAGLDRAARICDAYAEEAMLEPVHDAGVAALTARAIAEAIRAEMPRVTQIVAVRVPQPPWLLPSLGVTPPDAKG